LIAAVLPISMGKNQNKKGGKSLFVFVGKIISVWLKSVTTAAV
tara:strand:- start:2557 stop:2685 length:129 start_codon:yes stop_codon:yes gene_type:complete